MSYTINISQKEAIFLDSSVIIGLFSGDKSGEKIFEEIIANSLYINDVVFSEVIYKMIILKFLEGGGSFGLKRLKKTLAKYLYLYDEFQNFLEDFEIKFLVIK